MERRPTLNLRGSVGGLQHVRYVLALLGITLSGCSGTTPPSSAPSVVTPPSGISEGIASGLVFCSACPAVTPIPDTLVTVIDGPGVGTATSTDQSGRYSLHVPLGPFRLRFTHQLWRTQETLPLTMTMDGLTIQTVGLSPKPWTVIGSVTDRAGTPMANTEVRTVSPAGKGGLALVFATAARTDSSGRYSFVSTLSGSSISLVAVKEGYEPGPIITIPKCCSDQPDTANANLQLGARVVSITLTGPTVLKVGDTFAPRGSVRLDDGKAVDMYVTPEISDTRVVRYGGAGIEAMNPGSATLTWWYPGLYWCEHCGSRATLQIVVTND